MIWVGIALTHVGDFVAIVATAVPGLILGLRAFKGSGKEQTYTFAGFLLRFLTRSS